MQISRRVEGISVARSERLRQQLIARTGLASTSYGRFFVVSEEVGVACHPSSYGERRRERRSWQVGGSLSVGFEKKEPQLADGEEDGVPRASPRVGEQRRQAPGVEGTRGPQARSLPVAEAAPHAAQCPKLDMSSPLSRWEKGTLRIKAVDQSAEQTNFLKENKIDVIITSPLERARLSCDGLFGTNAADLEIPILENELLVEQKASEYLVFSWLKERSQGFIYWLSNRPEKTIVVVSHSAYLRAMPNTKIYFSNCTVWQTTLNLRDYKGQRYYK